LAKGTKLKLLNVIKGTTDPMIEAEVLDANGNVRTSRSKSTSPMSKMQETARPINNYRYPPENRENKNQRRDELDNCERGLPERVRANDGMPRCEL
jgi:hypothetical protein